MHTYIGFGSSCFELFFKVRLSWKYVVLLELRHETVRIKYGNLYLYYRNDDVKLMLFFIRKLLAFIDQAVSAISGWHLWNHSLKEFFMIIVQSSRVLFYFPLFMWVSFRNFFLQWCGRLTFSLYYYFICVLYKEYPL